MTTKKIDNDHELRGACMSVLLNAGYAGPPYNLDDVSASIYQFDGGGPIEVSFWDMHTSINKDSPYYSRLEKCINSD